VTADARISIPTALERCGLALGRPSGESTETSVAGDPCIVWDEEVRGWRMFLFYSPPGHAQAICLDPLARGPWTLEGPLSFTNQRALLGGGTHKP